MEPIFIFGLIVVLVIRWTVLRSRMSEMQSQIAELTARVDVQGRALGELHRKSQPAPQPQPQPDLGGGLEPARGFSSDLAL